MAITYLSEILHLAQEYGIDVRQRGKLVLVIEAPLATSPETPPDVNPEQLARLLLLDALHQARADIDTKIKKISS